MPARTPRAAVEERLGLLKPIAACLSIQPFGVATVRPERVSISFLPFARPIKLRRGDASAFDLDVRLDYAIATQDRLFHTMLAGYSFAVSEPGGQEIIAFHWHPDSLSAIRQPHLHLSGRIPPIRLGRSGGSLSLSEVHVPSGFVTLAAFVGFLIGELGVRPLRPDWQRVVGAAYPDADHTTQ